MTDDNSSPERTSAPGDRTRYLFKRPKPRAQPDGLRPIQPPGTAWRSGHYRFSNADRDWTKVSGHFVKLPNRQPGLAVSAREKSDHKAKNSLLLLDAELILAKAFRSSQITADGEVGSRSKTEL